MGRGVDKKRTRRKKKKERSRVVDIYVDGRNVGKEKEDEEGEEMRRWDVI